MAMANTKTTTFTVTRTETMVRVMLAARDIAFARVGDEDSASDVARLLAHGVYRTDWLSRYQIMLWEQRSDANGPYRLVRDILDFRIDGALARDLDRSGEHGPGYEQVLEETRITEAAGTLKLILDVALDSGRSAGLMEYYDLNEHITAVPERLDQVMRALELGEYAGRAGIDTRAMENPRTIIVEGGHPRQPELAWGYRSDR